MANTNLNQRAAAVRDHVWTPKNTGLKEVTEKSRRLIWLLCRNRVFPENRRAWSSNRL